jgi:hypothetical protein
MNEFLLGMIVMGCLIGGLFFLHFWRKTRDRLFLVFAMAFWLLALNWFLLAATRRDEDRPAIYLIRLLAFVLILIGCSISPRASVRRKPRPSFFVRLHYRVHLAAREELTCPRLAWNLAACALARR